MMSVTKIVLLGLVLVFCTLLLTRYLRERQKEIYRMEMMRSSKVYRDLYPLIEKVMSRDIDQVRIERDRITFTQVYPPGTLGVFELTRFGHRHLTANRARVITEVLAEDIENLHDSSKYRLTRYRIYRSSGDWDYGYVYTIRSSYKDRIMESHRRFGLHTDF